LHFAQHSTAETLRIDLADLNKLHDIRCDTVALPRTGWLQNMRNLITGVPYRLHEIENVWAISIFTSQQAGTHCG
jgi:hypothetical protein